MDSDNASQAIGVPLQCPVSLNAAICRQESKPCLEANRHTLSLPCRYSEDGCTVRLLPTDFEEHVEFCQYALTDCPLEHPYKCWWTGRNRDILQHCLIVHRKNVRSENKPVICRIPFNIDEIACTQHKCTSVLLGINMELYKVVIRINSTKENADWCVMYLGPHRKANKYFFNITFENSEGISFVAATCQPYYEDDSLEYVKFVRTDVNTLRYFCDDAVLPFSVSVGERY